MSATATKSVTKPKTRTKTKKPQSAARAEASRRNAQKSTGPKSDDGKAKSRFNALKHGMTAQSILLPGDDGEAFASRLRYLLDDLQPRNSLEGVVIERLAGDLWKSDRAEGSAGARISFRLRHEPVDQVLKDRHEAIELGQHLLWQPAFPLPVGLNEGEAKGALAKFPLTDVPGDPLHPARLLLNLESTVAGCDWLLGRWADLRFQLEMPGQWRMADVWKMVRLLGKTAIAVKDDYQVALLVLASLAFEPEPKPEPSRPATFAEAVSAMTQNDGLSRVVAGITRLCEPFQQALARMPLDKLAPESEEQARQRLFAVVEQEEGRIGRIRAMLQKIADADLAEAPVRLAFETGTEGDRGRRYILSYERLVNRRIDTFLKVRKASGSGELDLVELEKTLGKEELAALIAAAGTTTSLGTEDLRSGDGRGRETRAQHAEADADGLSPAVSQMAKTSCDDDSILRNEANAAPDDLECWDRLAEVDAPSSQAAAPGARWTSQLDPSHPASISGDGVDVEPSPQNETSAAATEPAPTDERQATSIAAAETAQAGTGPEHGSAGEAAYSPRGDDDLADPCGELSHSVMVTIEAAPTETPGAKAACDDVSIVNETTNAEEGNPHRGEPIIACATAPPVSAARLAELLVPMDRAALALLTKAELDARRWAMFQATRTSKRKTIATRDLGH